MNNNSLLLSVCIQTYNHENYIKECLDGILSQVTNFDFEIILGEDDSNDNTRSICKKYQNLYPDKIKLFLRSRDDVIYFNGKATGRFNFISNLSKAKGKYIALCEGDDYWTDKNKLQKQVDFLESNPEYSICFHNVKIFNQRIQKFQEDNITREVAETTTIEDLSIRNFIHTPSVVFKNNFILPEWFNKPLYGDWTLYMLTIKDKKIKKINDTMAVYRFHDKGIIGSLSKLEHVNANIFNSQLLYDYLNLTKNAKNNLSNRIKILKRRKNRLIFIFYISYPFSKISSFFFKKK